MPKTPFTRKHLFLLFLLFLSAGLLWARDVSVSVTDADLELPLEGAVVHSWDGTLYECDADGQALISVPDGRQVTVQITYPGYETGRLVIPASGDRFSLGLRLGGLVESRDLVIEAARPGVSETRSGRSVAISGETLERSSQIGLIEDVMTSIKLLPGVGYTGMFNAMPSIRGGDPGDLMAALDGFYIENPYHWGGGFSIFDPHMVGSAQLSHGIFSTRYGHTISGLLEVSSKKASTSHAELELGVSTSAVNLNAALPLGTKGGLMLMGKVTYWDPFVWMLKQISTVAGSETLDMINSVSTAPFIRSAAASFNYRFNSELELNAAAFAGADGVGAEYRNEYSDGAVSYKADMAFDYDNLITFVNSGISFNPRPSMVLRALAGAGYEEALVDANIEYDYLSVNSPPLPPYTLGAEDLGMFYLADRSVVNVQGRFDFDWDPGKGFLFSAGVQELFSETVSGQEGKFFQEIPVTDASVFNPPPPFPQIFARGETIYLRYPFRGKLPEVKNQRFNSSAYMLTEYSSPAQRFGAELGLRVDHLYLRGKDFDLHTVPAFNPRLNLDFNVFRNGDFFESLDLTAGTGLFSSMNDGVAYVEPDSGIDDFELRPNRSWTSILGVKTDFARGWSFNLEGYFKYVFNRAYSYYNTGGGGSDIIRKFNGDGIVWGFDFMLQKFDSRYWDGWLSYTFTHARYHEPEVPIVDKNTGNIVIGDSKWYYPGFHRFHNFNLVLNFKPVKNFNVYTRLGLASGRPKNVVGEITANRMILLDKYRVPDLVNDTIIYRYKRDSKYSDDSRTTWSIPLDVKLSYFIFHPGNKVQTEMYIAAENLASLFYTAQANTSFNTYTGQEDTGSDAASYEMPVPMVSVGLKWSF